VRSYEASVDSQIPVCRGGLSFLSSRVKQWTPLPWKIGEIGCPGRTALSLKIGKTGRPEPSITDYQSTPHNVSKETAVYKDSHMNHAAHCMGKTAEFIFNVEVGGGCSYGGDLSD
jgi:hypothetical protein